MAGPLYIALVDESATTFLSEYERNDLDFLTLLIDCRENQKPVLTLQIKNPYTSLLNSDSAGSLNWIWISEDTGTSAGVVPRFFGHIIAIPDDLDQEVIAVQWLAEASDWLTQKQLLFESTLKVAPNYDPLFYDPSVRDDPDSIDGWSGSYHFDRIALPATAGGSVTFSDWINAEDGTYEFFCSDGLGTIKSPDDPILVPYDSVHTRKGKPPLTAVTFECDFVWDQVSTGFINFGTYEFKTYCGSSLIGAWPRPGETLGAGYSVWTSLAVDKHGAATATMLTSHYVWQSKAETHRFGDVMSVSVSYNYPSVSGDVYTLQYVYQPAFLQAGGSTGLGGSLAFYPTVNRPLSYQATYLNVLPWDINGSLWLRYDASRKYIETLSFTMLVDVQPWNVIVETFPNPNFELIKTGPFNVGVPLLDILNRSSVQGHAVGVGTLIYPNDPSYPGGQAYQIYTQAGTTATTPPDFSDVVGEATSDGSAVATSLGLSPTLTAPNWTASLQVPRGFVLNPIFLDYLNYLTFIAPGLAVFPNVGVAAGIGMIVQDPNGNFQYCYLDGTTGAPAIPSFATTPGAFTYDGSVTWICIGPTLPDGTDFYLCTNPGLTELWVPNFNNATAGTSTTADGSTVVWTYLGKLGDTFGIPVGGTTGNVTARSYVASDRGNVSTKFALSLCRAKALWRARNFEVEFDCSWDAVVELNCRMNAQLTDDRLPGGIAVGKITGYQLRINGDEGLWDGHVTMACTVGNGGEIITADGNPTYAADYNPPGQYQYWTETVTVLETADVGYTPPAFNPQDDGLQFPLDVAQVTLVNEIRNSMTAERVAIEAYVVQQQALAKAAYLQSLDSPIFQAQGNQQMMLLAKSVISFDNQINGKNVWLDLQLVPLTDSTFETAYNLTVSTLVVPETINLSLPGTLP